MASLLSKAFAEAAEWPGDEQDQFAAWMLEELASEREWRQTCSRSHPQLARLAREALTEYEAGRTQDLDPETL